MVLNVYNIINQYDDIIDKYWKDLTIAVAERDYFKCKNYIFLLQTYISRKYKLKELQEDA